MAFLTHDVLANLTHITTHLLPYYLLTAQSNRENWTRYYVCMYLAPQFILNRCQVQQNLELQIYCHL